MEKKKGEVNKNKELTEALLNPKKGTLTIPEYLQNLIREILAGKEGDKNDKLIKSLIDTESEITIQEYIQDLIKKVMWSISASMLVGKDGIQPPKRWDKNLSDKRILDKIEAQTGIKEKDPNICLTNLWRAVIANLIPGSHTMGGLKNSLGNLLSFNLDNEGTP